MTPNEVVLTAPDHVLNPKAPEGLSFTGYISLSPNTNGEPLMAHELATTNGKTAMAYFGDTPWHRLGTKLNEPATAAEAIIAAGLNYQADLKSIQTLDGKAVTQRKAVVRSDTGEVLGVVGNSYVPVQNHQAFSFLDGVAGDGGVRYHTAGALGNGERVWMLAKLPSEIRVKDSDDVTEKFLLLSNSHDGSSALRVFFTPIRVVCANTLGVAERKGRGQGVSITHKGDLNAKVQEARTILGIADRFFTNLSGHMDHLASVYPTRQQLNVYFESLYPDTEGKPNTRAKNIRGELFQLFEHGRGQNIQSTRLTMWSAFNAVTEYVDHHRSTRGRNEFERESRRLESAWFGSGAHVKARAWELALNLAA